MENYEYYTSQTRAGGKVRPSNWIARVAILASTFDKGKRLQYNNALIPSEYNGISCLRVDRKALQRISPEMYACVMNIIDSLGAKKLD